MTAEQRTLPVCRAPCWPIPVWCMDCPFGSPGDGIEIIEKYLHGEEQPAEKEV